jgi:hypothetical protein
LDGDDECDGREIVMVFIYFFDRHRESKTHQNKYTKRGWCTKKIKSGKICANDTPKKEVFFGAGVHIR